MILTHMKMLIRQDADMVAVKEILAAYEGARLDEAECIVYYDTNPKLVSDIIEELHPFQYGIKIRNELV